MSFTTMKVLVSISVGILMLGNAAAQNAAVVARIERYLAPFLADGHLSGTVLVAKGEKVLFERAYGMANYELQVKNTVETRHCIASITKPMTLAIAIRLMEEGKLGLRDTLDKWFKGFPNGSKITVEHLLRHRAGIPHRLTKPDDEAVPRTAADMVELAKQAALIGEPGARSSYSSGGYAVLARVLEVASGKSYDELLQAYVCRPAGMKHTVHTNARSILIGRAQSYMPRVGGLQNAPLKDLSFLVGAGSVYSTASDLHRLIVAVRANRLGASVRASMSFKWNGATNGFRAFADHHSATEITVIVTANLTTGAINLLREHLPRIAAGEEVAPRPRVDLKPITLSTEQLRRYEGAYSLRPGTQFEARVQAGEFIVGSYVLVPTGTHEFFSVQDYTTVKVQMDDDGRPTGLMWGSSLMRRIEPEKK